MKIALLGSIGFLGKALLSKALDAHYEIKTLESPCRPTRKTWPP
jgi:hypothetical protein